MCTGDQDEAIKYAEDVWQLEKELAAISVFQTDRTDPENYYNLMTLGQLQDLLNQGQHRASNTAINITNLLSNGLGRDVLLNETVMVSVPDYMKKSEPLFVRRATRLSQHTSSGVFFATSP